MSDYTLTLLPLLIIIHAIYKLISFTSSSLLFRGSVLRAVLTLSESIALRLPVGAAEPIPEGQVLAIVVVEVQMVRGMTGGAVHDLRAGQVLGVIWECQQVSAR